MGQVYKAFDPRLHREIAIKIAAERFSERFDREVRAIATLNHPNICTIHDVGPNYLVTELVDGETLRDWFRRAVPIERNLEIARQVLEALRAAHHADIVHRDLKPENVMVRSDGYVKVLDFGLAARMPTSRVLQAESFATTDSTFIALEPTTSTIDVSVVPVRSSGRSRTCHRNRSKGARSISAVTSSRSGSFFMKC